MNSSLSLSLWRTRVVKRAWWLNGFLIASLALGPSHWAGCAWSDADNDGNNDTFTDANGNVYALTDLDNQGLDPDNDGAYNSEELAQGSDPFDYDSDDDGLNDGDEIHLGINQGYAFSLTNWDSDGDSISDYDEYYGCDWVTYPGGQLPSFANASYWDYDGDGIANPSDPYPQDPTNNDSDGDGIDDAVDPDSGSAENYSWNNYNSWWGNALNDDDGDAILNYWDSDPWNSSNGSSDTDGDGIDNSSDPFPDDYANGSWANGIYWYGDVFGDADSDGILNYEDSDPYGGSSNGESNGPTNVDGDDFDSDLDPNDDDPYNTSPSNGIAWYGLALEDTDNDGIANYWDEWPEDQFNGDDDVDDDLILNGDDPFPWDSSNYSAINATSWGTTLFDDDDGDLTLNWQDPYPNDEFDGLEDFDGDGIFNGDDPFPRDSSNTSPLNGVCWGGSVNGDDDSDGTVNGLDESPYPVGDTDTDGDGIPDSSDPFLNDGTNYSWVNMISWGSDVLGNDDGDGYLNYEDQYPDDPYNGDSDIDDDGIENSTDPAVTDSSNFSNYNSESWYSNALGDEDDDGVVNFYDYEPRGDSIANSDGDEFPDVSDPAPQDPTNYSSINYNSWYGNALGDDDGDGMANFYDESPWPPPPMDSDSDGLTDEAEAYYGTNIYVSDTDGDNLSDGDEVNVYASDPTNPYSISEGQGYGQVYTDDELVNQDDTDGDGLPDLIEIHYNLNPYDGTVNNGLQDLDNNGVNNLTQHLALHALDADLDRYDADSDGMSDVFEETFHLAKGNFNDAVEDPDEDGVTNYEEMVLLLDPQQFDTLAARDTSLPAPGPIGDLLQLMIAVRYSDENTLPPTDDVDGNSIPDWADAVLATPTAPDYYHFTRSSPTDLDGDALPDTWEHLYGRWKYNLNGLQLRKADADEDADNDTLTNLTEFNLGTNPLAGDSDENEVGDADEDLDGDGLTNAQEQTLGTNGLAADSDGDGLSDSLELRLGLDPLSMYSGGGALADGARDYDGDQISNLVEVQNGLNPAVGNWGDSDDDGTLDVVEVTTGSNPLAWDTDVDGAGDTVEIESENNPLSAAGNAAWANFGIANF